MLRFNYTRVRISWVYLIIKHSFFVLDIERAGDNININVEIYIRGSGCLGYSALYTALAGEDKWGSACGMV